MLGSDECDSKTCSCAVVDAGIPQAPFLQLFPRNYVPKDTIYILDMKKIQRLAPPVLPLMFMPNPYFKPSRDIATLLNLGAETE